VKLALASATNNEIKRQK